MLKIRRPLGRLIFNMGIAIPGKTVFLIETAPWYQLISGRLFSSTTSEGLNRSNETLHVWCGLSLTQIMLNNRWKRAKLVAATGQIATSHFIDNTSVYTLVIIYHSMKSSIVCFTKRVASYNMDQLESVRPKSMRKYFIQLESYSTDDSADIRTWEKIYINNYCIYICIHISHGNITQ